MREFYREGGGFPVARIASETTRNSILPATRLMYFLGTQHQGSRQEIGGPARSFHDDLLGHGHVPLAWAAEELRANRRSSMDAKAGSDRSTGDLVCKVAGGPVGASNITLRRRSVAQRPGARAARRKTTADRRRRQRGGFAVKADAVTSPRRAGLRNGSHEQPCVRMRRSRDERFGGPFLHNGAERYITAMRDDMARATARS